MMKKMNSSHKSRTFLATTALDIFWDKTKSILFLGEWCTQYKNKHIWEKLDCETLNDAFEGQDWEEICEFIDKTADEMLCVLIPWLNEIHHVEYSKNYWRALLGPFLFYHVKTVYDRYHRIQKAFLLFPDLKTWGLKPDVFMTPMNGDDYYTQANLSDAWNLQLITQIISKLYFKALECIDENPHVHQLQDKKNKNYQNNANQYRLITRIKIYFLWMLIKLHGDNCVAFFSHIDFSKKNKLLLMIFSFLKIIPVEPFFLAANDYSDLITRPDYVIRNQLTNIKTKDIFSKLALDLLIVNMPLSFIENYHLICKISEKKYPHYAKVLAGVGLFNEEIRLFYARNLNKKMIGVGSQHSGSYGVCKISDEFLEQRFMDYFLEWGTENNQKVIGLPVVNFCQKNKLIKKSLMKFPILWITTEFIQYAPEIKQAIDGKYDETLFLWNSKVLNLLNSDVFSKITMRLRHTEFSDNWKFLKDEFPLLKIYKPDSKLSFYDMLCKTNLLLIDNLNSTFFYGLGCNIPTIIFCDETMYKVRESAKYCFNLLQQAGVYHITPESAAKMVNEIHDNPQAWWATDKVQRARKAFCDYFIKNSKFWLICWKNELISLL